MFTLFLMLLSPPTSPSPRVEEPNAAERPILKEEVAALRSQLNVIKATFHAIENRPAAEVRFFLSDVRSKRGLMMEKQKQLDGKK